MNRRSNVIELSETFERYLENGYYECSIRQPVLTALRYSLRNVQNESFLMAKQ